MTGTGEPKNTANYYKNTNNKTESLKTPPDNAECKHVWYYEPVVK